MGTHGWHTAAVLLLSIAASVFPLSINPTIALEGNVPRSITDNFLLNNYLRIWKAVAPTLQVDSQPVHILFYTGTSSGSPGARLPEWGGGGAIGRDTIIVPLDRLMLSGMDAGRVTVHELVHIVLARAYGGIAIPRWFHEGMAMTLSGELLFDEQVTVSRAIFTHRLMPLDAVERVNALDQYAAALAYSESHLAVMFLIKEYGLDTIPEFLDAVRTTGRFDTAMVKVLGFTPKEFESFVNDDIVKRYSFIFLISDSALYWIPITLLFIAAFIAVTIRNKKKRRMMEEEERKEAEAEEGEKDGIKEKV
jgi:hypothetical protein